MKNAILRETVAAAERCSGSKWPATSASTCREPLGESAADCPVGLRAGSEARFPTDCRAWPSTDGCTIAFPVGYAAGSVEADASVAAEQAVVPAAELT